MSTSTIPPLPVPSTNSQELNNYESTPVPLSVGNGKFDYISDKHSRDMLQNGWRAVNCLELWNFMTKDTWSYMFSGNSTVDRILAKMEETGAAHSGASFGWTMRQLQFLAQCGEEAHRAEWLRRTEQE